MFAAWIGSASAQTIQVAPSLTAEPAASVAFPIRVSLPAVPRGSFVRVRGLPSAASLSEGHSVSPGSWAVPMAALSNLKITLPAAAAGRADILVTLVDIDGAVLGEAKSTLVIAAAPAAAPPPQVTAPPLPEPDVADPLPALTSQDLESAMRPAKRGNNAPSTQQPGPQKPGAKRPAQAAVQPLPQAAAARDLARRDKLSQNSVTVISGNPYGTYLILAYDLANALDDGDDLRVLPVIGRGRYQNIMDVVHLKGVDLGITQSNIIGYLKKSGELGPNIDQRVTYITRLYNEEMHVLAGPGINRLQDLAGRKVDFGEVGGATQFSLRLIFELLGIKVEEVNIGPTAAYPRVRSGEFGATVQIASKPNGPFGRFRLEPGMKLLPVPYSEVLEQDYLPARLTHEDYPALVRPGTTVETIAVASVLATYNWPRDTDGYRRVAAFTEAFFNKFADLQKPGMHPKWKETNLAASLKGWKRFPAAEEWLAKNEKQPTAATGGIDPARAREQASKIAPSDPDDQNKLFNEFMEWKKGQGKR